MKDEQQSSKATRGNLLKKRNTEKVKNRELRIQRGKEMKEERAMRENRRSDGKRGGGERTEAMMRE